MSHQPEFTLLLPYIAVDPVVCPAQREGLVLYSATLAPATGSVTATAQCADNAHLQAGSSLTVTCSSTGSWTGQTPVCECDTGYEANNGNGGQLCQSK